MEGFLNKNKSLLGIIKRNPIQYLFILLWGVLAVAGICGYLYIANWIFNQMLILTKQPIILSISLVIVYFFIFVTFILFFSYNMFLKARDVLNKKTGLKWNYLIVPHYLLLLLFILFFTTWAFLVWLVKGTWTIITLGIGGVFILSILYYFWSLFIHILLFESKLRVVRSAAEKMFTNWKNILYWIFLAIGALLVTTAIFWLLWWIKLINYNLFRIFLIASFLILFIIWNSLVVLFFEKST